MKKSMVLIVALIVATAIGAIAGGMTVTDKASFSATGDAAGTAIDKGVGKIANVALCLSVDTNATLTVYRAKYSSSLQAAVSASATVVMYTPGNSNKVSGFTLTTDDYLLVRDTGSNGWQLRKISAVGVYASNYTSYTVASAVTAASDSPVYVVDATDNMSIPADSSSDQTKLQYMFVGFSNYPIYLLLGTGSGPNSIVSGTVDYVR